MAPYLVYRLLTASLQSTRNFSITLIVSGLEKSVSSPKACEKFGDECTESCFGWQKEPFCQDFLTHFERGQDMVTTVSEIGV